MTAVATVAGVFAYDGDGNCTVCCFLPGDGGNYDMHCSDRGVVFASKLIFFVKFLTTHLPIQAWIA